MRRISGRATSSRSPTRAPADGWRAFLRGVVGRAGGGDGDSRSLARAFQISGGLPFGGRAVILGCARGLGLALALADLGARALPSRARGRSSESEIARLCARVENDWVGARTGLLDQLASLYGAPDTALCIDFQHA